MSEEKRKEEPNHTENHQKSDARRIVTVFAFAASGATFFSGLFILNLSWWCAIVESPGSPGGIDVITLILLFMADYPMMYFWHIAAIGLALSIVTLLIERDESFRWLPMAFVLVGLLLYGLSYLLEP